MTHPEHKSSRNQYLGRTNTRLGLKGKMELKEELNRFNERVRKLLN